MSASFTVCMHSYICVLLQRFLSFLTAHLQTCPSVFIFCQAWNVEKHISSLDLESLPRVLTFGSFSSSSSLSSLCISVLLATESVLYPRAFFWARAITESQTFPEHAILLGIFLQPALKTKVGLISSGSIFNLCMKLMLHVWRSSLEAFLFIHLFFAVDTEDLLTRIYPLFTPQSSFSMARAPDLSSTCLKWIGLKGYNSL